MASLPGQQRLLQTQESQMFAHTSAKTPIYQGPMLPDSSPMNLTNDHGFAFKTFDYRLEQP